MKKIALLSAIALSTLIAGCSSTETRSDEAAMGDMQACTMKQADGKACPMEGKVDAKACAKCKEMKDGKMCADCKAKMHAKACAKCKEMKDGQMCDKCKAKMANMKGMGCKMGDKKAKGDKMCAKCEAKKAAMNDDGSN